MAVSHSTLEAVLDAEVLGLRGVEACLGRTPITLELGFGRAELILELAEAHPERAFLGVEVSRKRVVKAGRRATRREIPNAFLIHSTAEFVVERVLPEACVEECWINCPDPWPKKRHHKRRLVQAPFLRKLAVLCVPGAILRLATDHAEYAAWMHEALSKVDEFENAHAPRPWTGDRPERILTGYEAEWLAEGRTMAYFTYRRVA